MLPTPEQRAVIDAVRTGTKHVSVSAVAGSGKTTTLVEAAKRTGNRTGFTAFNKHIAAELGERLNGAAETMTLHGLGFRFLASARPGIDKDDRKARRHLESLFPKLHRDGRGKWAGRKFLKDEWAGLPDAISVCRQQNVWPTEDLDRVVAACYRQGVELPDREAHADFFKYAGDALASMLDDSRTCDFDDMIYMPLRLKVVRPEYATLFVDEAQDLNPAQQELALGSGDRLGIVGDPKQAIMGFAGADELSFFNLCDRLGESPRQLSDLGLSACFRCPESHLRLAQLIVPRIQPAAFADEGEVAEKKVVELVAGVVPGDMVICRNTAPLVGLAYLLISRRVPVMVRGRKIGQNLADLMKQLRPIDPTDLVAKLTVWGRDQVEKLEAADAPEESVEQVEDRVQSLTALASQVQTLGELSTLLGGLFSDGSPGGKVLLSTVHRAKGLEADRVWIYEPGLMPSRAGEPQELNLLYVALTRAKQSLFLVDDAVRRLHGAAAWVANVAAGESRYDLTDGPRR